MLKKLNKFRRRKTITEIDNTNITPEEKVELLKRVIADKDKIIDKYRKICGEIKIATEEELIFKVEEYKKEQEELVGELKKYKDEYAGLVREQRELNEEIRERMGNLSIK